MNQRTMKREKMRKKLKKRNKTNNQNKEMKKRGLEIKEMDKEETSSNKDRGAIIRIRKLNERREKKLTTRRGKFKQEKENRIIIR